MTQAELEGDLEGLIRDWERGAASLASGEEQYQDDYLNRHGWTKGLEEVLDRLGRRSGRYVGEWTSRARSCPRTPHPDPGVYLGRRERQQAGVLART
ncbi:MAG: hypothetical protein LC674_02970 [Actinobacteria bacterium]|nr:hypothetical protein [Actinomycetota bacterium]